MSESHTAVIIIGSGSAGLTAALYAARANLSPLVFEGKEPGGQLTLTTDVDNFPGFPEGIKGPELMDLIRKQAQRFGADCKWETVFEVDLSNRPFRVRTTDDPSGDPSSGTLRDYTCDGLIVATGASARWLGIEGPYRGNGVSTCATCDGHFYRGKEIAVVGGGDSAAEEATFLTRFATKVTLIHRRDALRASKIMQDRVKKNPKIDYAWNSTVDEIHGESQDGHQVLTGVKLRSTKDATVRDLKIDGLFLAIGHVPNTSIFKGQLAMTPERLPPDPNRPGVAGCRGCRRLDRQLAQLWDGDQCGGGLRLRRCCRHALSPGNHGGRVGMRGGHGLRKMAGIDRGRLGAPLREFGSQFMRFDRV